MKNVCEKLNKGERLTTLDWEAEEQRFGLVKAISLIFFFMTLNREI